MPPEHRSSHGIASSTVERYIRPVAQHYSRILGVVVAKGSDEHAPGDAAASLTMDLRRARIHSSTRSFAGGEQTNRQIAAVVLDRALTGRGHVVYTLWTASMLRNSPRLPGRSCAGRLV